MYIETDICPNDADDDADDDKHRTSQNSPPRGLQLGVNRTPRIRF